MIFIKPQTPAFIVFEGIDGSGKTTQSLKLETHLKERGFNTSWFREPSDSSWGQKIRELALKEDSVSQEEELDLFVRDRKWNIKNNLMPALKENNLVIMDRYFYSTICYQGARGFDMEQIYNIHLKFAPIPDKVFIIDLDAKTALTRIKNNRDQMSKLFEKEEFLIRVRENYLNLSFNNITVINGQNDINSIFSEVLSHISI